MSFSLVALKIFGPAIAKRLLDSFEINSGLTNIVLEQAIDTATDELLSSSEARENLSQKSEQIAKQLEKDMRPLFEREARNLESGSQKAILLGVAETLFKARLTSDGLAQINFDVKRLNQHLLNANPEAVRFFTRDEVALYQRAIAVVTQSLIEAAPQVEGFALSTAATTLQRLDEIANQLKAEREQSIQAADEFAAQYRRVVQDELDCLEVFGLPRMDRLTSRQSLSMAYISLSVSGGAHDEDEKSPLTLMGDEPLEPQSRHRSRHIDEVICDCRRLIIRGGAGAGKSTLLQWLAVRAATQSFPEKLQHWNYKIPFFIRLRSLINGKFPTPEVFPALIARNFAAIMPTNWVHRYLKRGQALVLIDGVDELPRQERQDFFESLKDLVRDFSEVTYVVTSRPSGLKNLRGEVWQEWEDWVETQGFVNLTLEPMSATSVEKFVIRWHAALPCDESSRTPLENPAQTAENLNRQLRQRSELRRLASTPLLCAMICALHRERLETLPSSRLLLYSDCIDMLLNRRDAGRKIPLDETYPTGLNESQKIELLQSLALKLMRLNLSALEADRVDSHFTGELGKTSLPKAITGKQIRELFVDRSGLLREPVVQEIDFAHRTFQEYLAAKAAIDDDSFEELLQKATDDQWRESIIVAAGLARPKERVTLLNSLIEKGNTEPDSKNYLHLLAVACLETATTVDQTTRNQVLACAKTLLPPKDRDEVMMVARAGNEIVPLLKYEAHYSADEACKCIDALVQIGTHAAMQILVDYAIATFEDEDRDHLSIYRAIGRGWNIFAQSDYLSSVLSYLKILDLRDTEVSDISSLNTLTQLVALYLSGAQLTDISPLSALTQLSALILYGAQVTDISPLSTLTQLSILYLSGAQVTDISPLSTLTQLRMLYLSETKVMDILPLSSLTQLEELDLSETQVTDILPLSSLTQLEELDLSETQVTDILPLSSLTQLKELDLSETQVTDILPLSSLTQLKELDLSETQVTDILPLSTLTQLRILYLSETQVTDISPLNPLSQLTRLYLSGTQVTDILPLSTLTQLRMLYLSETQVTDISPLNPLSQLTGLYLSGTQVTNISPLSALTQLTELDLSETQVSNISLLSILSQLKKLDLSNTQVMDISPLSALTQLKELDLSGTQVTDISPLRTLSELNVLNLSRTQVPDASLLKHLSNLRIYINEYDEVNEF
jgi:Leucine-rich repeat (LRR) protein